MASKSNPSSLKSSPAVSVDSDTSIAGLEAKHEHELQNLTLTKQPLRTFKLLVLAIVQYLHRSALYLLAHGGWLMLLILVLVLFTVLLVTIDGPHERHVEEVVEYLMFGLWWVALGVASSIGLGSGLHTFVLYLGPHIALFTIKAMKCGRVDIKSAPYDTIQLKRTPSWLEKNCSEFGPSLFSSSHGSQIPLTVILPQIQLEAILWGIGTVLGELPPYFISRAAQLSGNEVDPTEDVVATRVNKIQRWFRSHKQYLNFFTILILASVPNPLFDLAGIMCGQFGVPFWTFFFATLIGKAIIKTHIQTILIILVCNNQLLDWIENKLIGVLSLIPGFASVLPGIVSKVHSMRDKYMATPSVPSNVKVKRWDISVSSIWNAVVLLMIANFFNKIVTSTAQSYLKKQQEKDLTELKNKSSVNDVTSTAPN